MDDGRRLVIRGRENLRKPRCVYLGRNKSSVVASSIQIKSFSRREKVLKFPIARHRAHDVRSTLVSNSKKKSAADFIRFRAHCVRFSAAIYFIRLSFNSKVKENVNINHEDKGKQSKLKFKFLAYGLDS